MDSYSLEVVMKSIANHRRIDFLHLLATSPNLSVEEVAEACNIGYQTTAVHLSKLTKGGLVSKKYYGRRSEHTITPRGKQMLKYLRSINEN